MAGARRIGTKAPPGFGAVIQAEGGGGKPAPGTSMRMGGGRGSNYATTRNGPKGDAAQQAHTNSMNAMGYETELEIHAHKEKLGAQLEFNERDRANETAHHAERLGNELGFHALKQLKIGNANDAIDVREMHRHLSAGSPYAAQAHADRYNASETLQKQATESKAKGVGGGSQLEGVAPKTKVKEETGFTPVGEEKLEPGVSDREKSGEVNAEPEPQEERPEVKPEASNVPEATENATRGIDESADETPAAEEAKAKAPTPPEPVAEPESSAETPDTKAPTPESKAEAIADTANVKGHTLPEGIPAQPKVGSEAKAEPEDPNKTQPLPRQPRLAPQQQAEEDKKVNRRIRQRQAASQVVEGVKGAGKAAQRIDAAGKKVTQDEGGTPIERESTNLETPKKQKPESLRTDDEGPGSAPAAEPYEERPTSSGRSRGRSRAHFLTDLATVSTETVKGGIKGLGEGKVATVASAALGPEGPPVTKTAFVARGLAKGFGKGVAKNTARHAVRSLANKEQS